MESANSHLYRVYKVYPESSIQSRAGGKDAILVAPGCVTIRVIFAPARTRGPARVSMRRAGTRVHGRRHYVCVRWTRKYHPSLFPLMCVLPLSRDKARRRVGARAKRAPPTRRRRLAVGCFSRNVASERTYINGWKCPFDPRPSLRADLLFNVVVLHPNKRSEQIHMNAWNNVSIYASSPSWILCWRVAGRVCVKRGSGEKRRQTNNSVTTRERERESE